MAPPRKPAPDDLAQVREMCRHPDGTDNPGGIARHYSMAGTPVDQRTVARWLDYLSAPTESVPSRKTINEIIRESGDDPDLVEVTKVRGMRYDTPSGENVYTSVEWKPSIRAIIADTDGWKRPKIAPIKKGQPQLVAICGDQHAPEHDRDFHAKFLSWLSENRPARIIILGDLLENADVSRWADRDGQASAKESVNSAYNLLRDYIDASPDSHITWIEGNHDQRIDTYATTNSPKVSGICRAGEDQPVLSIPHLLHLDDLRIEYVSGYPLGKVKLTDKLAVIHGKIVKKGAGATALANLEKRGHSVVSGHTHRLGIVFKTVMDIDDEPSTLLLHGPGFCGECLVKDFRLDPKRICHRDDLPGPAVSLGARHLLGGLFALEGSEVLMTSTDLVKQFVQNALNRAGLSHSTWHKNYSDHRLDAGDLKYGVDSYKEKDCAAEAAEEGIDGANWAGFEWAKRWEADTLDRSCDLLPEAAEHFAIGYELLRQYKLHRDAELK